MRDDRSLWAYPVMAVGFPVAWALDGIAFPHYVWQVLNGD